MLNCFGFNTGALLALVPARMAQRQAGSHEKDHDVDRSVFGWVLHVHPLGSGLVVLLILMVS